MSDLHGCMSQCPTCKRGCTICNPCDLTKHGGLVPGFPTSYPIPLRPKGGLKCEMCGSTAIDHTEMHCQMNRNFKKLAHPNSEMEK